jgi:[ribosomal protein S5]-alanine N-acetyltransferase
MDVRIKLESRLQRTPGEVKMSNKSLTGGYTTHRLRARDLVMEDWEFVTTCANDPRVNKHLDFGGLNTEFGAKTYIANANDAAQEDQRQSYKFGIELRSTKAFIGSIWLDCKSEEPGTATFGFFLFPSYWNSGYASEAVKGLLGYAFNKLNLENIVANCDSDNAASRSVLEKNNMLFTKVLPKYRVRDYGAKDALFFELRKNEWLRLQEFDEIEYVHDTGFNALVL